MKTKNQYVWNSPSCSQCGRDVAHCKCKIVRNIKHCYECGEPVEDCRCGWVKHPDDPPIPETDLDFNEPEKSNCHGDGLEEPFAMADEVQQPPQRKPNYLGASVPASAPTRDEPLPHIELTF